MASYVTRSKHSQQVEKDHAFDTFLRKINISEKGRAVLKNQNFDEETLKAINSENFDKELQNNNFIVPKRNRTRFKRWKESLNQNAKTKKNSPKPANAKTKKNSPKPANAETKKKSSNNANNAPSNPPTFFRQDTVSGDLLHEILNYPSQRMILDDIMKNGMKGIQYEEEPVFIHRHETYGFYSNLKKNNIYYRWDIKRGGSTAEAFHLSLHNTNENHSNRTGHNRDIVGALHVRIGTGRRHFRRILINLVNGVYEITVCVEKTAYDSQLDPIAKEIIHLLVEYYNTTGRKAKTVYDNGKGPKRALSRC